MNNEPVAWIVDGKIIYPAKTLTDEEIIEICQLIGIDPTSEYIWQFARAILRKAQEK